MSNSTEIHTGDIGEALVHYRLLLMGVPCKIVNIGTADIVAIIDDEITVRIQVKTAHVTYDKRLKKKEGDYGFNVCRGSKVKRPFKEHECDVFALVGIERGEIMFVSSRQLAGKVTKKVKESVFDEPGITETSWARAIRPLLYT